MCTIFVQELTAKVLPIALPPTVNPAANADIIREIPLGHPTCALAKINAAIVADAEPDTTPQMSPTTSLQIELTRSALRKRRIASWAPGTFREAMEWNGFSSADATAIPIMSKIMPTKIITSRIKKATSRLLFAITSSDTREMVPEIKIVTKNMVTTHLVVLFRSRLEASGSDLANVNSSFRER